MLFMKDQPAPSYASHSDSAGGVSFVGIPEFDFHILNPNLFFDTKGKAPPKPEHEAHH
jgi:hypothetical protein